MQETIIKRNFSISNGGLFYRLELYLKLVKEDDHRVVVRSIVYAAVSWLPLLIFSSLQGPSLLHDHGSFLYDIAAYTRFLFAVPLLTLAANVVDYRYAIIAAYFPNSKVIREGDKPKYFDLIKSTRQLCDSWIVDLVLLALAYALSFALIYFEMISGAHTWRLQSDSTSLSPAGWWFALVSMPLFYFLLLRWGARFIMWCIYLRRLSQMNLQLVATHPDLSGGLGILSESLFAFAPITFACSAVLASEWSKHVLYDGAHVKDFINPFVFFVLTVVLLAIGPLLIFSQTLVALKMNGLHDYGMLANRHSLYFDKKWIGGIDEEGDQVLGTPDVSSLADLGTGYQTVKNVIFVPFGWKDVVPLLVSAGIPMIPFILIEIPVKDLLSKLSGLLH